MFVYLIFIVFHVEDLFDRKNDRVNNKRAFPVGAK